MVHNPKSFGNEIPLMAIPSAGSGKPSPEVSLPTGEECEGADGASFPTFEDSVPTATETGTATSSRQIDESAQTDSFWYRRRLDNYPGSNRDNPDVWSLFTRSTEGLNYDELEEERRETPSTTAEEHTCRHRGCLENHGDIDTKSAAVCSRRTRSVNIMRMLCSIIQTEVFEYYPWIPVQVVKLRESRAFVILKEWLLEWLALLLSISSFMAIVILLSTYSGQIQPDFVDQISINALIAVFSTILRASVLFIVTEVIGEMKWQWMESPRSLRDMQYFTNAGTGPWGSLKFLFFSWQPLVPLPNQDQSLIADNIVYSIWTVVGAFIVIASAAIGPFSQQASATYPCSSVVLGSAEIRFAKIFSAAITSEMRSAAVNSLLNGGSDSSAVTRNLFKCPAESCTFKDEDGITHTSVGICSSCTETSAGLKDVVQFNNTDSLDDDSSLDGRVPPWPSGLNTSYAFKMTTKFNSAPESKGLAKLDRQQGAVKSLHNENMTVSIRALTLSSSTKGVQRYRTGATEQSLGILGIDCQLFPCIKRYYGQVVNGTLNESVVSQIPMSLVSNSTSSRENDSPTKDTEFMQFIDPCFLYDGVYNLSTISNATSVIYTPKSKRLWTVNGISIEVPVRCLGVIGYSTYNSIQSFVGERITGSCNVSGLGTPSSLAAVDCVDKWWLDAMFNRGEASFDSISDTINGMATSLTNLIRIHGFDWNGRPGAHIIGSSSKPAVCVQAYWAWLIYPGVLLVLTTVLFIRTSFQNQNNPDGRRRPVWKSNVLPLVFYGFKEGKSRSDGGDDQHDVKVPLLKLSELEAVANQIEVRFDNDANAPGLVTKAGENSLKSVLVDLKHNGVSALSKKKRVRSREKSKGSGNINFRAWLRRRRATGDGTDP